MKETPKASNKGALVSTIVVVALVVVSSAIIYGVLSPTFEQGKSYQDLSKAKQTLSTVDNTLSELAFAAAGSKRSLKVALDVGSFEVSGKEDKVKIILKTPTAIFQPGTALPEGNYIVRSGPFMKAYEDDANGDGTTDLILENDALLFAVRKVGNSTSWASLNTTTMIPLIRNKLAPANITPLSGIRINDLANSSYGNGYTEITSPGSDVISSGIRVFMNSSANIQYEALFILGAGQDFVELEVKSIKRL